MALRDFKKLEVWQLGRAFATLCYRLTAKLPREEQYNLTSQIRRASVSIPANIAEGAGRGSDADFLRFLRIALGSLNEVETLVLIANDLGLVDESGLRQLEAAAKDLGVRLRNLISKIDADIQTLREPPGRVREEFAHYDAEDPDPLLAVPPR